jgi:hypothetical protein
VGRQGADSGEGEGEVAVVGVGVLGGGVCEVAADVDEEIDDGVDTVGRRLRLRLWL